MCREAGAEQITTYILILLNYVQAKPVGTWAGRAYNAERQSMRMRDYLLLLTYLALAQCARRFRGCRGARPQVLQRLSEARLARESSRLVWGLLVWGSSPAWRTSCAALSAPKLSEPSPPRGGEGAPPTEKVGRDGAAAADRPRRSVAAAAAAAAGAAAAGAVSSCCCRVSSCCCRMTSTSLSCTTDAA